MSQVNYCSTEKFAEPGAAQFRRCIFQIIPASRPSRYFEETLP